MVPRTMLHIIIVIVYFRKTSRCQKSTFCNYVFDNTIILSINNSETHVLHINLSRRTVWCACQLLVITSKLKLMQSETRFSIYVCFPIIIKPKNPKNLLCHEKQRRKKQDNFQPVTFQDLGHILRFSNSVCKKVTWSLVLNRILNISPIFPFSSF